MIILLHQVGEEGLDLEGVEPAEVLDLADPMASPMGPISYALHAQISSKQLVVEGSVRVDMKCECARCGVFFSTTLDESAFLRAYVIEPGQDVVDVTPDLREAVLLRIPSNPLCSAECRGLCPHCGTNRNLSDCACNPPPIGGFMNELDKLDIE